jgi:long-chain acyl-CoA synthetase
MTQMTQATTSIPRDIAAERADIDRTVAGMTIPSVLQETAQRYPGQEALKWRTADGWQALTWSQYREAVRDATLGLRGLGFRPGEFGLIMARNRPEHLIADLALTHAGGRSVSVYNTLASEQIAYIAGHCEGTVAFVEDHTFLAKFLAVRDQLPKLRAIVLMEGNPAAVANGAGAWVVPWREFVAAGRRVARAEPDAFDASWRRVTPADLVALIYTSGTTGAPKGVTYTHHNILWTVESSRRLNDLQPGDRGISYLPLAHVAERFSSHWGGIYNAGIIHLVPEPTQVLGALLEVRPQGFVGVPRIWEKFEAGILAGLAAEPDEGRKALVQNAIATGQAVVELEQAGKPVPPELAAKAQAVAPILTAIRGKIGLDQCRIAYTSTAPTPMDVHLFFAAIGLPLLEVWGMSELTGPATANPPGRLKLGTVGTAIPGVEVKLAEDGEVLVRGGNVTPGYYRDPQRTTELLDADGWVHSGDVATVGADGYFRIIDRKKELIITSSGKNISPANVEALVKRNPIVGQAMAVGDGHSYICALIVLDAEVAPIWARAHGIGTTSLAALTADPRMVEEVRRGVAEANTHLAQIEQVKRFTLLPTEWTAESEELTPTLKLKRRVIAQKYAREIEGMYADLPTGYEVSPRAPAPVGQAAARALGSPGR